LGVQFISLQLSYFITLNLGIFLTTWSCKHINVSFMHAEHILYEQTNWKQDGHLYRG